MNKLQVSWVGKGVGGWGWGVAGQTVGTGDRWSQL
jgi:hypothetical protein